MVETNDEWITTRTGIKERRLAAPDEATSDLAVAAAQECLAMRGIAASELHAIIVCTVTPDMVFPATACIVQQKLGAKGAFGFDLSAACSGFVYGLTVAASLVATGEPKKVLVIGADTMSRIVNYKDRTTCILFGDGAGAFLVETAEEGEPGLIDYLNYVDGSGGQFLNMPAGGSRKPISHEAIDAGEHYVRQDGSAVFKYAVTNMADAPLELLRRNGLQGDDVKLFVPHQANNRIISAAADRLGMPMDRVARNIEKYGNTTGGTIPLAAYDAWKEGRVQKGDLVVYAAVGAGYTVGSLLWRWGFRRSRCGICREGGAGYRRGQWHWAGGNAGVGRSGGHGVGGRFAATGRKRERAAHWVGRPRRGQLAGGVGQGAAP